MGICDIGLRIVLFSAGIAQCSAIFAQAFDTAALGLDEIRVTARKMPESIQSVPVSVSAYNHDTLEAFGLLSIQDIAGVTPGVNFETQIGRRDSPFNTSIRGISSISAAALSFKPFANFVDGVYVRGSLASFDLSDVQQVEILRGPQAALYGRATEAGAINYITMKPTDDFQGRASLSLGGFDYQRESLKMSGPILPDILLFNLTASNYNRGGEYLNRFDGRNDDTQKTKAAAGSLRFAPSSAVDAVLRVGYSRDEDGPPALGYSNGNSNNCFLAVYPYLCGTVPTVQIVNLDTRTPEFYGYDDETTRASLNVEYRFSRFTLTSLSGWDSDHQRIGEDQSYDAYQFSPDSGLPADGFIDSQRVRGHSLSQELRLTSPRDSTFRYMAGVYGYYETVTTNDVQGSFDLLPTADGGFGQLNYFSESVKDVAGFGSTEYDILPKLTISGELRWQRDRISYEQPPANYANEGVYSTVDPRLVLNCRPWADFLLYESIGKGTKPGGFNNASAPQRSFSEEKLWGYEIGAKTEWLDHKLRMNLALYYNSLRDLQVTQAAVSPSGALTSYDTNAAEAHTQGVELEMAGKIGAFISVRGTYSFNESKYDDFQGFQDLCNLAGQYTPDFQNFQGPLTSPTCLAGPQGNARGKTLANAPRHLASLQADLAIPLAAQLRVFLRPQVSYKSSSFEEAENLAETGSQTIVDLRLGLESTKWSVTGWARNMNDNRHADWVLRYVDYGSFNPTFYGPNRSFAYALPERRQFGLEANVKF